MTAAVAVSPRPARAQSTSDVQRKIEQSGHTEQEVRDQIRSSRMTPDQIRQALRDAGYDPDALNAYLPPEGAAAAGGAADTTGAVGLQPGERPVPPSGALTAEPAPLPLRPAGPIPVSPESLSEFTREIARRVPAAPLVYPFGYEIFGYAPATFEPLAAGPVDPDYPIGPGDEVIVQVWGDNEFTHSSIVSREATITVPDIGQVVLNGLTLAQAKRLITDRLGAVYSGIRARRPTTFVDVTLGKLRTIQVFILGDVVRPGGYTISSVSTVLNALYNAGGPTARGSMRDVRIIRHNEVFREVDLYGYILTGSRAEDVRLQSGDVVFIPPVGKTVAVLGEVHRPAIYELKPGERFLDLLRLSGGIQSTALLNRAQIDRIIPFGEREKHPGQDRVAMDLPLRELLADSTKSPELVDRDIVQIFRVGDVRRNIVAITGGTVIHAGTYEIQPGMKISDLVRAAGGLYPDAYLDRAYLVRTSAALARSIRPFNLGKALQGDPEDDLPLEQLDSVAVASVWDIHDRHTVTVSGSVRKPGAYEYLNGMTVMDLIFRAGGLQESAYKEEAEVSRVDSTTIATTQAAKIFRVPISGDYAVGAPDTTFQLQKNDQVFVRAIPEWQLQENVSITGEVKYPGVYSLNSRDERLSSVIERAGGLNPAAYPRAARFTRAKDGAGRIAVRVDEAVKGKKRWDLVLEDGDAIYIPTEPRTVKVVGEVGFAASVLYDGGKKLDYYVAQAGGYTDRSDKGRTRVIQPSGRVELARSFWGDPKPEAGALVLVPMKPPEEKKETLKDIATIVGVISGAATTIYLIHQATK